VQSTSEKLAKLREAKLRLQQELQSFSSQPTQIVCVDNFTLPITVQPINIQPINSLPIIPPQDTQVIDTYPTINQISTTRNNELPTEQLQKNIESITCEVLLDKKNFEKDQEKPLESKLCKKESSETDDYEKLIEEKEKFLENIRLQLARRKTKVLQTTQQANNENVCLNI